MLKSIAKAGAVGALAGVTTDYLAAVITSYKLNLGYFMAYIASLPEQVGGEMNAVLLQMLVCILLGAGLGIAWRLLRQKQWKPAKKILWAAASIFISLLLSAAVAASMVK